MELSHNDVFETLAVPKAIAKLAVPTMLGMLVTIVYNLADTFFVGQLNDANQVAAVTLAAPIFMWLMALGSIFGVGGGAYISRLLGQKKIEKCKYASSVSFYGALAVGIICIILGIAFINPIMKLLGANEATWEYTRIYSIIFLAGSPFVMLSFAFGQIVRAEGSAKSAMVGMMLGTVINIVLDPILILTFDMGVAGAAYATVFANIISVVYYMHYCLKKSPNLSISLKHFKINSEVVRNILLIGLPASLNNMLFGTSTIVLNNFAEGYGNTVIAALGIIQKATMLPIMLLIGLCIGVQPLIGYNYAAGNHKRLQSVLKTTVIVGTVFSSVVAVGLYFTSPYIVGAFLKDSEVIALGTGFLKVNVISVPFLCTLFLMTNTFQALGKAVPSMILSVSRQGFIFIPVLIIANRFVGLSGIVWAQPIADILSTAIALLLYFKTCHNTINKNDA